MLISLGSLRSSSLSKGKQSAIRKGSYAIESCKVVTSERGQSCNVLAKSSQTIYGKDPLVGEIERCEVQLEARDLKEKRVEVTVVTR